MKDLNYFKKELIKYLNKVEKKENKEVKKSILDAQFIQKAGFPVGTIREWKGKKYMKIAPNKWRRKYDSDSRGAKMAIAALKRKISNITDPKELLDLVLENRDRFSDENGRPIPLVQELSKFVSEHGDKINNNSNRKEEPKKEEPKEEGNFSLDDISDGHFQNGYPKKVKDINEAKEVLEKISDKYGNTKKGREMVSNFLLYNILVYGDTNLYQNIFKNYKTNFSEFEDENDKAERILNKIENIKSKSNKPKEEPPKEESNSSLNNELKELGIRWGKKEIAKNLNVFRRSEVNSKFWDYYKENKQKLKDNGFSVYKLNGKFYLYDWNDKEKATQEQYDKQENDKFKAMLNIYEGWIDDQDAKVDTSWIKNVEQLRESIEEETNNPEAVFDAIDNNIPDIEYDDEEKEEKQPSRLKFIENAVDKLYERKINYIPYDISSKIKRYGEKKLKEIAGIKTEFSDDEEDNKRILTNKIFEREVGFNTGGGRKIEFSEDGIGDVIDDMLFDFKFVLAAKEKLNELNKLKETNDKIVDVSEEDMKEAKNIIGRGVDYILNDPSSWGKQESRALIKDKINRRVRTNPSLARAMLVYIKQQQEKTGKTVFTPKNEIWKRLVELNERAEERKEKGESEKDTSTSGNLYQSKDGGISIFENKDWGRFQVSFPNKPDSNTLNIMRSNGFKWSPSSKTWVRMNNENGEYAIKRVANLLGLDKVGDENVEKSINPFWVAFGIEK